MDFSIMTISAQSHTETTPRYPQSTPQEHNKLPSNTQQHFKRKASMQTPSHPVAAQNNLYQYFLDGQRLTVFKHSSIKLSNDPSNKVVGIVNDPLKQGSHLLPTHLHTLTSQ